MIAESVKILASESEIYVTVACEGGSTDTKWKKDSSNSKTIETAKPSFNWIPPGDKNAEELLPSIST